MFLDSCLFCKIVDGALPATRLYENEHVIAFADIAPQAPFHALIVPKQHRDSILACQRKDDDAIWTAILEAIHHLSQPYSHSGFRTVINTGPDGGQTVGHLHVHLLAGRSCQWPPG